MENSFPDSNEPNLEKRNMAQIGLDLSEFEFKHLKIRIN